MTISPQKTTTTTTTKDRDIRERKLTLSNMLTPGAQNEDVPTVNIYVYNIEQREDCTHGKHVHHYNASSIHFNSNLLKPSLLQHRDWTEGGSRSS